MTMSVYNICPSWYEEEGFVYDSEMRQIWWSISRGCELEQHHDGPHMAELRLLIGNNYTTRVKDKLTRITWEEIGEV